MNGKENIYHSIDSGYLWGVGNTGNFILLI